MKMFNFSLAKEYVLLLIIAVLFIAISVFYVFGFDDAFKMNVFYHSFFESFTDLLGGASAWVMSFFVDDVKYHALLNAISINGYAPVLIKTNFAFRYFIYFLLLLVVLPGKRLASSLYFLLASFLLFIILIIKTDLEVYYQHSSPVVFVDIALYFRTLILLFIIYFKVQANPGLKRIYTRLNDAMLTRFNLSILYFLIVFLAILPFSRMHELFDFNWFSQIIIQMSSLLTEMFNYNTHIVGNYIFIETSWVYLGSPCLGIGVIMMFVFLITTLRSQILNKIIYIILGSMFMVFVNSIRVSYLLVHMYENGKYNYSLEVHDMSNRFFFTVVFFIFMLYVYWFQYIDFKKLILRKN